MWRGAVLLKKEGSIEPQRVGSMKKGKERSEIKERFGRIGSRADESFLFTLKFCQHLKDRTNTVEHPHLLVVQDPGDNGLNPRVSGLNGKASLEEVPRFSFAKCCWIRVACWTQAGSPRTKDKAHPSDGFHCFLWQVCSDVLETGLTLEGSLTEFAT